MASAGWLGGAFGWGTGALDDPAPLQPTEAGAAMMLFAGAVLFACIVWILFQTTSWVASRIGQVLFIWGSMAAFFFVKDMIDYGKPAYMVLSLFGNATAVLNSVYSMMK